MARIRYTGLHPLRDDNGKEIRLSSGDAYRGPFGHGFYGPSITTNYAYSAPQGSYSSYPQYTPPGYYIASDGRSESTFVTLAFLLIFASVSSYIKILFTESTAQVIKRFGIRITLPRKLFSFGRHI